MATTVLKILKTAATMLPDAARGRFIGIYRDHAGLVRRILFRMTGADGLDDAVQEVFLRVWKGLGGFDGRASVKTWVSRIAVYLAIDTRKKRRLASVELQDDSLPGGPDGCEAVEGLDHAGLVARALAVLDAEERALVVLYYYEGGSVDEIAEIFLVPPGTVKSRLSSVRERLKKFLTAEAKYHG